MNSYFVVFFFTKFHGPLCGLHSFHDRQLKWSILRKKLSHHLTQQDHVDSLLSLFLLKTAFSKGVYGNFAMKLLNSFLAYHFVDLSNILFSNFSLIFSVAGK